MKKAGETPKEKRNCTLSSLRQLLTMQNPNNESLYLNMCMNTLKAKCLLRGSFILKGTKKISIYVEHQHKNVKLNFNYFSKRKKGNNENIMRESNCL